MQESFPAFFAITRDISRSGMAFLSPLPVDFEMAVIALREKSSPSVVCRICNVSLLHANEIEEVYLANAEFMYEKYM